MNGFSRMSFVNKDLHCDNNLIINWVFYSPHVNRPTLKIVCSMWSVDASVLQV